MLVHCYAAVVLWLAVPVPWSAAVLWSAVVLWLAALAICSAAVRLQRFTILIMSKLLLQNNKSVKTPSSLQIF